MVEYHKFKKIFNENVYSMKDVDEGEIEYHFFEFKESFETSEKIAISQLNNEGYSVPDDAVEQIRGKSSIFEDMFENILEESILRYFNDCFDTTRIDRVGMCLKSNLIGKACQMRHDENMLGIVRGIDKDHSRCLYVDFGDEAEVKIDVDELIISGQKIF